MSNQLENSFESLESSYEYVCLLSDALGDARSTIEEDLHLASAGRAERRVQALHLVNYKLDQLGQHLTASRRILNDLRTLRRMLLGERQNTR